MQIKLNREFKTIAPEAMLSMWTENGELEKWWGPGARMSARPGGEFRLPVLGTEEDTAVVGQVKSVDKGKLALTWKWEDEAPEKAPSEVQISIAPEGEGTRLEITHDIRANANACEDGWKSRLNDLAGTLPFRWDYKRFELDVMVNASPAEAYAAWLDPERITKWMLQSAAYREGRYEWEWIGGGRESGKILEAIPGEIFRFDFGGTSQMGREQRTKVTVRFTAVGPRTRVHLTQDDIADTPRAAVAVYQNCMQGWSVFLLSLKSYLAGGVDLREKDESAITPHTLT